VSLAASRRAASQEAVSASGLGSAPKPLVRFIGTGKSYDARSKVVDNLYLDVREGEFLTLLGPSGSGKTTCLMMLAGFEPWTSGDIQLDGKSLAGIPPHRRGMGVVFQSYALFPHMTIGQNVAFPLRQRSVPRQEIRSRVEKALRMVELETFMDRQPGQLSGGQQQRVALARALVFDPKLVLMDEPLGALDKQLREQMQLDIRALHKRLGLTIVFVTHDQSEALTMSDRIAVFNHGRIEQVASPIEIYDQPGSRFVAEFIGETNLIEGVIEGLADGNATVVLQGGKRVAVRAPRRVDQRKSVTLSLRPEHIRLGAASSSVNLFQAVITDIVHHGDHMRVLLDAESTKLLVKADRKANEIAVGSITRASFDPADCWVLAS
jgi:putative spermidine/putrescine transport system ATP-binding protein